LSFISVECSVSPPASFASTKKRRTITAVALERSRMTATRAKRARVCAKESERRARGEREEGERREIDGQFPDRAHGGK